VQDLASQQKRILKRDELFYIQQLAPKAYVAPMFTRDLECSDQDPTGIAPPAATAQARARRAKDSALRRSHEALAKGRSHDESEKTSQEIAESSSELTRQMYHRIHVSVPVGELDREDSEVGVERLPNIKQ
jgi:hypothetical protein